MKRPLIRFALVGGTGFIADISVFYLCSFVFGIPLLQARAVSFMCAATVTWIGNRVFTFAQREHSDSVTQWTRSVCAALISAIPNFVVFKLTLILIGGQPLQSMAALVWGVLAGMVSNYQLSNRWVFR